MLIREKHKKIGKKALCLIFAFLFSINSFAAVVSDNDGSAFITKAEFDSLKNNFQSQIDSYNTNIDNKIDAAISAYLAGIKVERTTTVDIIHSNWETVTCLGYALENIYKIPNLNLSYNAQFNGQPGNPTDYWNFFEVWNTWFNYQWTRTHSSTNRQRRLLCDAGTESGTMPTYITWEGVARDLLETQAFNIFEGTFSTFTENSSRPGYLSGMNTAGSTFVPTYLTYIVPGYYPDLQNSVKNIYQPGIYWYAPGYSKAVDRHGGNALADGVVLQTGSTQIKLLEVDGKTKDYEHIIFFDNETLGRFTDVDWLYTLRTDPNASWTRQDPLLGSGGTGTLTGARYSIEGNKNLNPSFIDVRPFSNTYGSTAWTGSYGNADTTSLLPYLGVVNQDYDAKHIYQTNQKNSITVGKKTISKNTYDTLLEGMPVLAALDKNTVKWQPKFKTYNNGIETDYNVKVKLVVGTFAEQDTITTGTVVCKNDDQTEDYLVTSGGSCSYNFKMTKDGIVFAKWWPDDDAILAAGNWEIDLDIPNCKQWTRIESES